MDDIYSDLALCVLFLADIEPTIYEWSLINMFKSISY